MKQTETLTLTARVKDLLLYGRITKRDLANKLGISRVTLDTRLEKGNWKKGEIFLVKKIL